MSQMQQIHSPRMAATPQMQHMQRTPPPSAHPSTHSLQPPMQGGGQASPRFPMRGDSGVPQLVAEEVLVFSGARAPSCTPRPSQAPPVAGLSSGPRRATGGSQHGALQAVRQFGGNLSPNLSPRLGREMKLSIGHLGGDPNFNVTPTRPECGDKENNRDNMIQVEGSWKDTRDMMAKLQDANAQQSAKLASNEQALEKAVLAQRKAEALHEQLRLDLHEAQIKEKQKEATVNDLELQLGRSLQDGKGIQESCKMLEFQNGQLKQQLNTSERHHMTSDRSLATVEKERQAELDDKDQQLHVLQCQIHEQDVKLQEMHRQMREKEQAMAQMREKEQDMDSRSQAARQELDLQWSARFQEKDKQLQDVEGLTHEQEAYQTKLMDAMREKDSQIETLQEQAADASDKDQTMQQMKFDQQKQDIAHQNQLKDLAEELSSARQRVRDQAVHAEEETTAKLAAYKEKDDKEVRVLRQKVQDSKTIIDNLESQLRRTSGAASIIAPGEFMRSIKSSEAKNGFSLANARLASRNAELESEALLIRKENALLRVRLPSEVADALWAEAVASAVAASDEDNTA